jgi:ribonuclease HI
MELEAVIHAFGYVHNRAELKLHGINVYTDSQYVKRGITEWIGRWQSNGWKNAAKKPVKNQDLWKKLLSLSGQLDIVWHWVRGHSGNEMNELCDRLVKKEIQNLL